MSQWDDEEDSAAEEDAAALAEAMKKLDEYESQYDGRMPGAVVLVYRGGEWRERTGRVWRAES